MIINVFSDDPELTECSEAEIIAVRELLHSELFQKFCKGQHKAILKACARDISPFTEDCIKDPSRYLTAMQQIHAIAGFWLQVAEAGVTPHSFHNVTNE